MKTRTKAADAPLFGEQEVIPPKQQTKPKKAAAEKAPEAKAEPRAVAVREAPALPADPFVAMIREVALRPDLDVTKLQALLDMKDRAEDRRNREAFDEAMARMQPLLPVVSRQGRIEIRKKDASGERTGAVQQSTPFARWEDIVEAVAPILSAHGFALRFQPSNTEKGLIRVEGTLSGHGHREIAALELVHESSGSKNPIQAVGSTIAYGKRMIGCALLNIVTRGEDDDGKASGVPVVAGEPVTADELQQIINLAGAVQCSAPRLIKHLNTKRPKGHREIELLTDLPRSRVGEAIEALRMLEASQKEKKEAAK